MIVKYILIYFIVNNNIKKVENIPKHHDTTKIFRSKIADVPTPGYSGHNSVFIKPISYLNKDKINTNIEMIKQLEEECNNSNNDYNQLSKTFQKIIEKEQSDPNDVKYYIYYKYSYHI
jgi:hypothetical protein